ncbi:MAG: D-Ala-D-Ala carboxypeptidase family metallohydrolase [Alphaproteobacteria bacterium]|nr:D-Ala-D-Ala carboxypeptidase family metallohydrolase [Alphaproteobacteria bacterium]
MIDFEPLRNNKGAILFSAQELKCKGSGGIRLARGFAEHLIDLREAFGQPMRVLSCCRSTNYNKKVGGALKSFHIYDDPNLPANGTCAIDIATPNIIEKDRLFHLAKSKGWSIGVYKNFLHLDRRSDYLDVNPLIFHRES